MSDDLNAMKFETGDEPELEVLIPGRDEIPPDPEVDPEFKDLSKEDLVKKLKEEREGKRVLEGKVDSVSAITNGLEKLNQNLLRPQAIAPQSTYVQPPVPPLTPEQIREQYNAGILDDAYTPTINLIQDQLQKLRPDLQQILQSNLVLAKENALAKPDVKDVIERYGQEVEEELARIPDVEKIKNPYVYRDVANLVKTRHFDEIVKEEVAKALEKAQTSPSKVEGSRTSTQKSFTETNPRPSSGKRSVVPTQAQIDAALRIGMTVDKYMEMEVIHGIK